MNSKFKPNPNQNNAVKFGLTHNKNIFSSVYSRVIMIIISLAIILFVSYSIIFRSVNEQYLNAVIHQNGNNTGAIVESALYHSMLRNDKTELINTLDIINTLGGIDEVNLYDQNDSLVHSSYSMNATHNNDPNCLHCHPSIHSMFPNNEINYRIIEKESACSMYQRDNNQRYLLIRNPIMNESSCYTSQCHVHSAQETLLGSLIIKVPLDKYDKAVKKSNLRYFGLSIIVTLLLSSFLFLFAKKHIKRPMHNLVEASRAVAGGDLNKRLTIRSSQLNDMQVVSLAFNNMLDNLQRANTELENWSKQLEYKAQKKSEELSAVQNELIQIERIASLGKLSASVAHELNNPLSGILVYTKLVQKQLSNPDLDQSKKVAMLKHLKIIEFETKRCGEIVKGLLDFSKKDQTDHLPCHLHEILASTYELMKHPTKIANISFITHFKATNDKIMCSPNQLKQACLAMLVNSTEAMANHTSGEIVIKTSNPDELSILLEIIDNGNGISEENLPHVFEPFFSTKHEASGIGLGLAIVHGIVQSHNGSIQIYSETGKGTNMSVKIPLMKTKAN